MISVFDIPPFSISRVVILPMTKGREIENPSLRQRIDCLDGFHPKRSSSYEARQYEDHTL